MGVRQTRVFAPFTEPEEDWAETMMGRLFLPLTTAFAEHLDWFWFSRYGSSADDSGDCDIAAIPDNYKRPLKPDGERKHRSLRFRYSISDEQQSAFEQQALNLIAEHGYAVSDFRPYDHVADTGGDRFLGAENNRPGRSARRAMLVTQLYMVSSRLVLDTLVGPDEANRFHCEDNQNLLQNPTGSSFQSIHHVFCNITQTPTDVYVYRKEGLNLLGFGTYIYPPPPPPGGWDESTAYPIWY